jgi:outer membrane protein TolC
MWSNRHKGALWQASLVFALLLSGCTTVGPDFIRPQVKVSQTWLDAGDQRVNTEPLEYVNWWRLFNDPVLDQLIAWAYRENLPLKIAGLRVLEARAQLGIAAGELYPQTQQAFGFLQYNRVSERAPQALSSSNLNYRLSEIGLQASWEIDFWGQVTRANG